jgi:hypothetical protein
MTTEEWRAKYEKDGCVDLWVEEEFNAGSRLVVGGWSRGCAVVWRQVPVAAPGGGMREADAEAKCVRRSRHSGSRAGSSSRARRMPWMQQGKATPQGASSTAYTVRVLSHAS